MCGIVACLQTDQSACLWDGASPPQALITKAKQLSDRISHRGPDETGVTFDPTPKNGFWMGHTRLSIVSPTNGKQPLQNKSSDTFVICNGEIYNHKELTKTLDLDPASFSTKSDSEVIIHAYSKIGVDVCEKLLGMFAFVLVDQSDPAKTQFLACRDKIGVKPLYLGKSKKDSKIVYFASELKAIVDQCDPSDLISVPAGHYWTPETGLVKYYFPKWDVEDYKKGSNKFVSGDECVKALEDAVISRCMADVEIGLLLSGGLDSSIIGAIMHQENVRKHLTATKGKIKSFAVGQEGSPDILAARCVSKFLGTEHFEALFTPSMAFEILEDVVYHMETFEPELIRSCIPNYFLARETSKHVKVVLTGEGSDEIWSGYLYFGDCKDKMDLQNENRRILNAVQHANLARCDRMTMAHSLEARVPFFDVENLAQAMAVDPEAKLMLNGKCEKHMLRTMYKDVIPEEVVWRTKAMQCEGVGMSWVKTLQDHISNNLVTDEEYSKRAAQFPSNTPQTKEEFYYRKIFEKHYSGCEQFVWVWPEGCRAGGASFKSKQYTREGLVDTTSLKKGFGLAKYIIQ